MACVWVYPPEILPLKIRAKGAALAAGADFLGNFLVVEITPPALQNIGYRTYIIFAVFNLVCAVIVWLFYPETMGLTLESVDHLFIREESEGEEDLSEEKRFYLRLQWWIVPRAWEAVRRSRAERAAGYKDGGAAEANTATASVVQNGKPATETEIRAEHVG